MKRCVALVVCLSFCFSLMPHNLYARKLPPANFGDMYSMAASGNLGGLLAAHSRGLDLDARDRNGDAGVCVAIKRGDYLAYNTFIKAGASHHPPCLNEISRSRYESFISSPNAIKYSEYPTSFTPRESNDYTIMAASILGALGLFWLVTNATGN